MREATVGWGRLVTLRNYDRESDLLETPTPARLRSPSSSAPLLAWAPNVPALPAGQELQVDLLASTFGSKSFPYIRDSEY